MPEFFFNESSSFCLCFLKEYTLRGIRFLATIYWTLNCLEKYQKVKRNETKAKTNFRYPNVLGGRWGRVLSLGYGLFYCFGLVLAICVVIFVWLYNNIVFITFLYILRSLWISVWIFFFFFTKQLVFVYICRNVYYVVVTYYNLT